MSQIIRSLSQARRRTLSSLCAMVPKLARLAFLLSCGTAYAQDSDFDPLVVDDYSAPRSVKTILDPTGDAPTRKVSSFTIPSAYCNPKLYDQRSKDSDCTWKSTRSQIRENVFATKRNGNRQPGQSWYGWYVYFPADFAYGARQTEGNYEFAYWHNHQCPHLTFQNSAGRDNSLYLQTNRALGHYECAPATRLRVANFSDLVGKWNKFEVFVKWANNDSGVATVYLNDKLVVDFKGPTLTKGYEGINYFKYGIYLCCTRDVSKIKGTTVYFTGVSRAATRKGLRLAK